MSSSQATDASPAEESEAEGHVQSLVEGRAKRATAGSRLSTLVSKEQDDEIELLFAENEQEEDESFDEDEEEASDVNLESSSSEEDREGAKDDDDLAGEKDLQRQARQETKKRKAKQKLKLPGVARKRVKIDTTAIKTPLSPHPRPKKKSERVSWVATTADAPTRVSSRKLTVQNRETVHKRLVDSEKQRLKVMRQMEEAQKRKEATKPKALTQAQRLEEAAKMEKKNAKSLTRWEESEKKRVAEQKSKLEALHNRQLSGPVVSWWSGLARWVNNRIEQLGVEEIRASGNREEPNKPLGCKDQRATGQQVGHGLEAFGTTAGVLNGPQSYESPAIKQPNLDMSRISSPQPLHLAPPQGTYGFLDGIHAYAAMPAQKQPAAAPSIAPQSPSHPSTSFDGVTCHSTTAPPQPSIHREMDIEYSTRNVIALKNVDANAQRRPELQQSVLIKKHKVKLQKVPPEQCVITGQVANFREPKTGLPYAGAYAYKEIQRLRDRSSRWSNLLECYVGPTSSVAKGVPERFRLQSLEQ